MNDAPGKERGVVVAGVGSPNGDDQAGWGVVVLLQKRPEFPARVVAVFELNQLLAELDECSKLIVVDACRSGNWPGTVSRLEWPDPRIAQRHTNSTHSLGVSSILRLAEALGRLPETVIVYGIEISHCEPGRPMSAEVTRAVKDLEEIIAAELCEVVHA